MVQSASADVSPPHPLLAVLEVPRALAEYASFTATSRLLSAGRSGHGRPVLVLPGMLADDRSTRPLRRLLNTAGYTPNLRKIYTYLTDSVTLYTSAILRVEVGDECRPHSQDHQRDRRGSG